MKKLLLLSALVATSAAFADNEVVAGTTEVGMLEISSAAKNCIVAVPYKELTSADQNICASNIVKTANLAADDELYVYSGGNQGSWTAWVLTAGTDGAKYWRSVGSATIGNDGTPTLGSTPEASATTMVPGSAIWLRRQNPSSASPFYVYGKYTSGLTTSVLANVRTLVANPTTIAVQLTSKFTATTGDAIYVLNDDGEKTDTYVYGTLSGTTGWYKRVDNTSYESATVPTLAVGCGVWLKLTHAATIDW